MKLNPPELYSDRIERDITLGGPLDDDQRKRLMMIADRCPIHRLLQAKIDLPARMVEG